MFDLYTVNNTDLFDFGVNAGDTQLEMILNGNSPPINLSAPIQFFGRTQHTIFVSRLWCVHYSSNLRGSIMNILRCNVSFSNKSVS